MGVTFFHLFITMVMTCVDLPELLRYDLGIPFWRNYHVVCLECFKLGNRLMANEFIWQRSDRLDVLNLDRQVVALVSLLQVTKVLLHSNL